MTPFDPSTIAAFVEQAGAGEVVFTRRVEGRSGRAVDVPAWVCEPVRRGLAAQGVERLWRHQAEVAERVRAGRHTVVATGTASGKSLGYLLPVLTRLTDTDRAARSTALYLSPTKALAADQASRVAAFDLPGVRAAVYDGDTPSDERRWIRRHASYVLTNPDMLHHGLLPGHEHWARFLAGLDVVVVDECHTYKGVFGAHVAAVLRRLRRVAHHHGADPTFVLASATVDHPARHARALVGVDAQAVTDDASPSGATLHVFVDPRADGARPGAPAPDPATASSGRDANGGGVVEPEAATPDTRGGVGCVRAGARLLAGLVGRDVQTVAFARSRQGTEVLASVAREVVSWHHPHLLDAVAAYRGGYLPEDRRDLEAALRSRRLLGVATTSALESGVDIGGLDAVLLSGWPGTRAAWWQRAGRAGRRGRDSLVVYVADDDPLDAFVLAHPETVFGAGLEACVLDPENPHVLKGHVAAAAAELPLTPADRTYFGPGLVSLADALAAGGLLRRRHSGWYWTRQERPTDHVSLRGESGHAVRVVEVGTGRVLGTVDAARADASVHTGAVHLHRQQVYVVAHYDADDGVAHVVAGDPGWSTQARSVSAFDLVTQDATTTWGAVTMSFGAVQVRHRVTSFVRRSPRGDVLGEHPLDAPERTLPTKGVWWTFTPESLAAAGIDARDVPGAAHAAEHAAIGLLPLLAVADRWDIGGVSTALHPDTGLPTVLVYDAHPGGAGFAERGHTMWRQWLQATRDTVAACRCASGCPACVQSPKCGNGNEPLHKEGAVRLLDLVLTAGD